MEPFPLFYEFYYEELILFKLKFWAESEDKNPWVFYEFKVFDYPWIIIG